MARLSLTAMTLVLIGLGAVACGQSNNEMRSPTLSDSPTGATPNLGPAGGASSPYSYQPGAPAPDQPQAPR